MKRREMLSSLVAGSATLAGMCSPFVNKSNAVDETSIDPKGLIQRIVSREHRASTRIPWICKHVSIDEIRSIPDQHVKTFGGFCLIDIQPSEPTVSAVFNEIQKLESAIAVQYAEYMRYRVPMAIAKGMDIIDAPEWSVSDGYDPITSRFLQSFCFDSQKRGSVTGYIGLREDFPRVHCREPRVFARHPKWNIPGEENTRVFGVVFEMQMEIDPRMRRSLRKQSPAWDKFSLDRLYPEYA